MGIAYITLRDDDIVFSVGHCSDMEALAKVFRPYIDGDGSVGSYAKHDCSATIVRNIQEILKRLGAMLEGLSDTARVGENHLYYRMALELLRVGINMPPKDLRG